MTEGKKQLQAASLANKVHEAVIEKLKTEAKELTEAKMRLQAASLANKTQEDAMENLASELTEAKKQLQASSLANKVQEDAIQNLASELTEAKKADESVARLKEELATAKAHLRASRRESISFLSTMKAKLHEQVEENERLQRRVYCLENVGVSRKR